MPIAIKKLPKLVFVFALLFTSFSACSVLPERTCFEKLTEADIANIRSNYDCVGLENQECLSKVAQIILQTSANKYQNMKHYSADSIVKNTRVLKVLDPLYRNYIGFSEFKVKFDVEGKSRITINGEKYKETEKPFISFNLSNKIKELDSNAIFDELLLEAQCDDEKYKKNKSNDIKISQNSNNSMLFTEMIGSQATLTSYILSDLKLLDMFPHMNSFALKGLKMCGNEKCYAISSLDKNVDSYDFNEFWIGKDSFLIYKVGNTLITEKTIARYEEIHENIVFK